MTILYSTSFPHVVGGNPSINMISGIFAMNDPNPYRPPDAELKPEDIDVFKKPAEILSHTARVQLSFFSYLRISLFIALGFIVTLTLIFSLSDRFVDCMAIAMIFNVGFSLIVIPLSAAISYPLYQFYCEKKRGIKTTGKFSIIDTGRTDR